MGMSLRAQKNRFILMGVCGRYKKMSGKKQNMDRMCKILQIEIDLEDPTPFIDQVFLSCTQREASVDPRAVHSKNELFNKFNNDKGG